MRIDFLNLGRSRIGIFPSCVISLLSKKPIHDKRIHEPIFWVSKRPRQAADNLKAE